MITRQRIVTFGIPTAAVATVAAAALLTQIVGRAPDTVASEPVRVVEPTPAGKHAVDVVFAVDTTGSMGGLIDGAKRTVWSIANHIRSADPDAHVRIGLVAFRDVGDDYVTRDLALTGDLDAVFAELSAYQAHGGNDVPENVDAALDVALHKMKWRSDAKKLVFVVGDAPPASRGDVPTFDVLAREAKTKNIVINAIRAGHDRDTMVAFQEIASLSGGEFSSIQQDGGVRQIATPYDSKLATLQSTIDSTALIMGGEGARGAYQAKMAAAAAAPAEAKADRATYYAGTGGAGDSSDMLAGIAKGAVDPEKMAPTAMPAELAGMTTEQRNAEIATRSKKRAEAQAELVKVAKEREEWLSKQPTTPAGGDAFDTQVKASLVRQLKR